MTKSRGIHAQRQPWTDDQVETLRTRYPNEKTAAIAADMGRPIHAIYRKAQLLGLSKSYEFNHSEASGRLQGERGIACRFQKGLTPWNKGTHFTAGGRSPETRFKPGQSPHNTSEIGSYRYDKDGTLQRKISNAKGNNSVRWRGEHELVWVAANGPVPPKHIVVFKPGMRTTEREEITIDRVECISLADNMRRNTRHNLPPELNEIVQLRSVLTRQINKRSKA